MKTVLHQMPPFKHEFYAIAIKLEGGGYTATGNYSTKDMKATVFFNSPYQIIKWDIVPDWKGFYIIFSEDFYRGTNQTKRITDEFPFLLVDNTAPLEISLPEAELFYKTFKDIYFEHHAGLPHAEKIIRNHVHVLLYKTSRIYAKSPAAQNHSTSERDNDLNTVSRFRTLLETSFYPDKTYDNNRPHQVQFYAEQLNIHPNHLNAIIKRITGTSASEHIYKHILSLAKSKLRNTGKSVKEIAFELYYDYPNHFASFFKKHTGQTPGQYRQSLAAGTL
ncbi:MAG: helix-turn-helix domain-containing protein [Cytophagales bacterium]|nr:helix-turn-helix domain-containing protein [Cytophagales bacterium]